MEFNLVTNLNSCFTYIQDNPLLLYYSHIPTAIIALIIGLFVFLKNRDSLVSKILLFISVSFALWSLSDLGLWTSPNSKLVMLLWSWINLLEMLVSVFTLYFAYVFLEKKDVSIKFKLFFGSLLAAFAIFIPTRFNLTGFHYDFCESLQGPLINYYYILEAFFSLWLVVYLIGKIFKSPAGEERKKTVYLSLGVILFLLSFSGTNVYSSMTMQWEVLQYGLFGMVVFMGFLAYMIVKYKAFNIKLLGVQALIVGQFIAIAAMLAFVTNLTNQILISVTLVLTLAMGWNLIRSVKKEIKAREELEVANEELAERKGELQTMSDKLSQSNDQLRKLDNAKSEFISIASHQLRTPLTAIKGFISMLLEGSYGKLIPDQEVVLNKVYTSNERLVTLVEDLLNVSRIESGRMEFKLANCQLADVCQEVYDTFAMRAKEHDLYLEYKRPEIDFPEVLVDKVKVREVISNLVDNALKYTLDGHGGVTMKLGRMDEHLRVTISDTGIGIPKTELPYLFAKFSRGKDIGRLNTGGTGLGLYVGKAMIENNGGRVWAESDGEGKGSRFIIELPLEQSEELIKKWG